MKKRTGKMAATTNTLSALLFNTLIALFSAALFGFNPTVCVVGFNAIMIAYPTIAKHYGHQIITGYAFTTIAKEVFLQDVIENFFPEKGWLALSRDMDEFVENNTINIADVGMEPEVLLDNTTYPLNVTQIDDTNVVIGLHTLRTKLQRIGDVEAMEASYDKRKFHTDNHKRALLRFAYAFAAHAFGPAGNTANTPVVGTTGADDGTGHKLFTFNDLFDMGGRFSNMDDVDELRVGIMNPWHMTGLLKEDKKALTVVAQDNFRVIYSVGGWLLFEDKSVPTYNKNTLTKKAFKAAVAGTDSPAASIFYCPNYTGRASGTNKMYYNPDSAEFQGGLMNFMKRFVALPLRNKYQGAVVSVPV